MRFLDQFKLLPPKVIFSKPSPYYREVKVIQSGDIKSMIIEGFTQSKTLDRDGKANGYWDVYLYLTDKIGMKPKRMLMLGLGGGTAPILFARAFPNIEIDVVEIDPVVI